MKDIIQQKEEIVEKRQERLQKLEENIIYKEVFVTPGPGSYDLFQRFDYESVNITNITIITIIIIHIILLYITNYYF